MTKVFISHAWEDKAALAEPLAIELTKHYEVWYDKFVLTIGDSLLQKINQGLAESDYGIVILSPNFFQKKWPKAELDGLMSVEEENRKVILPVWLNVTFEDVKEFSPILAGRLGVNGNLPIAKIVEEIRRATDAATRAVEVQAIDPIQKRLKTLAEKQTGFQRAKSLSNSEEGVQMVQCAVKSIEERFEGYCTQHKFLHATRNKWRTLEIRGPGRLLLVTQFFCEYDNSLTEAYLRFLITREKQQYHNSRDNHAFSHELTFVPFFNFDMTILWKNHEDERFSTDQLISHMMDIFLSEIESDQEGRSNTNE